MIKGGDLRGGKSKSCGCYRSDNPSQKTHGQSESRLYKEWKNIKTRCYYECSKSFKDYGGRGIKMCDAWKDSFEAFAEWAYSNGYREWLTIERIDVNGGYSPENCKFITMKEQARNKRNVLLTVNGITKTKGEWCAEYNINLSTLSSRLNKLNWSPERAVLTPVRRRNG